MVVIHWINRILNPVHTLKYLSQITEFLDLEKEHRETTVFFKGRYIPVGEYFNESPSIQKVVMLADSRKSYNHYVALAKDMVFRHDVRMAIVQDPELI